jgi:hypothetical protein
VRKAVVRGCRGWSIAVLLAGVLSGCGNFSLSGILDATPPDAPPAAIETLTLVPVTVNVLVSAIVKFTALGGVPPYTWAEDTNGTDGSIDSTGLYRAPATAGTYTVSVTDSAGAFQESTVIASATVPLSIHPVSISIAAGGSVSFLASGGVGSYTWSKVSGAGNLSGNTYTAPFAAEMAKIRVTDSDAPPTSVNATITVSAPLPLVISPSSTEVFVGGTVVFSASGGSGSYVWSAFPVVGSFAGSTYTAPPSAGPVTVTVKDTITLDFRDAAVNVIDVPVTLTITPSAVTINAGEAITFSAGGGTPVYTYTKITGAGSLVGSAYTAPFAAETATIRVTDAVSSWADATVTVNAPPPLVITPASIAIVTNATASFSASGGAPGYTYSVLAGGAGGSVDSGGVYTAPAVDGSDTVRVTDQASHTSDAAVTVYFPLTIVPTAVTVQTNGTYSFSASGGVPGYTYSVLSGGAGGVIDAGGLYTAPGSSGSDTVKVVDSIGNASTAKVTIEVPAAWSITSIDTLAKSGQYASLALDGLGDPRIAYYESQRKELRLATWGWDGTKWTWTVQTVDSTDRPGQYASLALESGTGSQRLSYYESRNADLMYADWNGASWNTRIVDSRGSVGQFTSLALAADGNPRIAYYDAGGHQLKYVEKNGAAWGSPVVVDTAGEVGQFASLALEPGSNYPRIAYYDTTNGHLKYAAWNGASWGVQTVDSSGNVGQFASLALAPGSNDPRIAYYDVTNGDLKHAAWNGSSWSFETVDSAGNVGQYCSLALDSSGRPRIAYYDATNKRLKYVENNGAWGIPQVVDSAIAGDLGKFASLRLNPGDNKPRIAYYNATTQDLKFAKKL